MTPKLSSYLLPKFIRVPFGIYRSTNFAYLTVIFVQWPKLRLGLDVLSNRKILQGIYSVIISVHCGREDYIFCKVCNCGNEGFWGLKKTGSNN